MNDYLKDIDDIKLALQLITSEKNGEKFLGIAILESLISEKEQVVREFEKQFDEDQKNAV